MPPPVAANLLVDSLCSQYLIELLAGPRNLIAKPIKNIHGQYREVF
jgi:hypothetical protein